jgi:hypothetical protein
MCSRRSAELIAAGRSTLNRLVRQNAESRSGRRSVNRSLDNTGRVAAKCDQPLEQRRRAVQFGVVVPPLPVQPFLAHLGDGLKGERSGGPPEIPLTPLGASERLGCHEGASPAPWSLN